jgi:hypothetical protein
MNRAALVLPLVSLGCVVEVPPPPAPAPLLEEDQVLVEKRDAPSPAEASLMFSAGRARRVLYVNPHGGTYAPARDDNSSANRSSILARTSSVAPYAGTAAQWDTIFGCVRDAFAPWDLIVTDEDPGETWHIEAVVGGDSSDIGRPNIGGVSPVFGDCSTIERAVNFTFTEGIEGSTRWICETIAHEVGHSLGLDHEYLCEDPMTYLTGCGDKTFQPAYARCGEYGERDCRCGETQSSHAFLDDRLGLRPAEPAAPSGPATNPPDSSADPPTWVGLLPEDGATLEGDGTATVSAETDAERVELLWEYMNVLVIDCDAPPDVATCERDGDQVRFHVRVGTGERTFRLRLTSGDQQIETEPRTITLDPPPGPRRPNVRVVSPETGASFAPGDVVELEVEADDDQPGVEADVWWMTGDSTFHFDLNDHGEGRFGIRLTIPGTQSSDITLRVAATDNEGNQRVAGDVLLTIE